MTLQHVLDNLRRTIEEDERQIAETNNDIANLVEQKQSLCIRISEIEENLDILLRRRDNLLTRKGTNVDDLARTIDRD